MRVSRVTNIDTDRLLRRQAFLVDMIEHSNETFERRRKFIEKAIELQAIENELDRREIQYIRKSTTATRSQS